MSRDSDVKEMWVTKKVKALINFVSNKKVITFALPNKRVGEKKA